MSLEQLQQNYADASGFVIDGLSHPPKFLGQAFLVSKSRAVTCASMVFNYTEAPWALTLHFVHPNVTVGVKNITLHNDFDKSMARTWYLQQQGYPGEQLILPNDMASLSLEFQPIESQQDKIAELNRMLTVPFSNNGVEASGSIAGSDFLAILAGILQTKHDGLLTLFDNRNIPLGRIQIAGGKILKVYFRNLLGELAFFELVYRKPVQGYAFQTSGNFSWGNVREIIAPAQALIEESQRRIEELPQLLAYLGGGDARYQKRIGTFDPARASEDLQWLMPKLWEALDGYITVDRLWERVGADTYTVGQALRELVNQGAISIINRASPFHCNGQLGQPLTSHTDFEVHAWDPLQAFYLDTLSGKPTWLQGNFFGVANALQPKNMLHTVPVPNCTPGALICKDYKLIGVHSGPHTPKPGQPVPPVKAYQMMWMGALLDMSSKKVRPVGDDGVINTGNYAALRTRPEEEQTTEPGIVEPQQRLICPKCYSANAEPGPCFNCGTTVTPPEIVEEEPRGLAKYPTGRHLLALQKKYNVTNKQLVIGLSAMVAIIIAGIVFFHVDILPPPAAVQAPGNEHQSSEDAVKIATQYAGFSGTAIPGYWYTDTRPLTQPVESFGMESEQSNNKVLFIIENDFSPMRKLSNFRGKPPYQNDATPKKEMEYEDGSSLLGTESLIYSTGDYDIPNIPNPVSSPDTTTDATNTPSSTANTGDQKSIKIFVGAFPSIEAGKSILVIARPLDPYKPYDTRSTVFLIDQMEVVFKDRANKMAGGAKSVAVSDEKSATTSSENKTEKEKPLASDEDLDKYCATIKDAIQAKLKLPDEVKDEIEKKHLKKLRTSFSVGIDEQGNVTKLELTKPAEMEAVSHALERAINACAPFADVPHTKEETLTIIIKYNGKELKVEHS